MMSVGRLQEKMKKIASTMMEPPPDQLTFNNRTRSLAALPSRSRSNAS
jgi:hypothetical protein